MNLDKTIISAIYVETGIIYGIHGILLLEDEGTASDRPKDFILILIKQMLKIQYYSWICKCWKSNFERLIAILF